MTKQNKAEQSRIGLISLLALTVLFVGCSEIRSPLNSEPNDELKSDKTISIVQEIPKAEAGDLPTTRSLITEKDVIKNTYYTILELNPSISVNLDFTDSSCTIIGDSLNISNFYEKTIAYLDTVDEMSLYEFNGDVIKYSRRGKKWYYKHWDCFGFSSSFDWSSTKWRDEKGWFRYFNTVHVKYRFTAKWLFSNITINLNNAYAFCVHPSKTREGNVGDGWKNPDNISCKRPTLFHWNKD